MRGGRDREKEVLYQPRWAYKRSITHSCEPRHEGEPGDDRAAAEHSGHPHSLKLVPFKNFVECDVEQSSSGETLQFKF